jgi:hypothetical protein
MKNQENERQDFYQTISIFFLMGVSWVISILGGAILGMIAYRFVPFIRAWLEGVFSFLGLS